MKPIRNILILGGSFSGASGSLTKAFQAAGCTVEHSRGSLRGLRGRPLYIAAMALEAMARRGFAFRRFLFRTRMANLAFGRANDRAVTERGDIDLVIQMGAAYATRRRPGVVYGVFTDHTNMLSKKLPDFGFKFPQRDVPAVWNEIERENLSQQDHIFVMGANARDSMIEDYGIAAERITVVGCGPNVDVDIERDRFEKPAGGKDILFVGLEAERKGLPALIQAFAAVRRSHPTAVLNVVGIDGTSANGVVYHGRLGGDTLKRQYYQARIFAMPSLREPFGIVFVEAMWSKAVCIGTNLGAMPQMLQHGFVVEPNDVAALTSCIDRLLADDSLTRRLAERAYTEARARFSWGVTTGLILDRANQLRAGPGAG